MKNITLITIFCIIILATACAMPAKLASSEQQTHNLSNTLHKLQQQSNHSIKIKFPLLIPKPQKQQTYYASGKVTPSGYIINIDVNANCHGTHYCNIGSLRAERAAKMEPQFNMQHKKISQTIKLTNNLIAYYTPAHAMADYWPTQLQWRDKNILYTLSWNLPLAEQKQLILAMANSIYVLK